jgi:carbamoyl-phosphate synthase large subunit
MNLLFTSAGRRGYLLDYFRVALNGRGTIHAANSDGLAASFMHADKTVVTPQIFAPGYIDFLLRYCAENGIHAIIPLFDVDIPVLAGATKRFAQAAVTVVVSNERVAGIVNDKVASCRFLLDNGFDAPFTYSTLNEALAALAEKQIFYPVVVKPRWGTGSIGLFIAENEEELCTFHRKTVREIESSYLKYESAADPERAVLVQQMIRGEEYGLDVVNDMDGAHITTFVKKKLAMRAGETDVAVTVNDPALSNLGARLGTALGHVGNLDVDVFKDGHNMCVLDLNARFGGGYPFSHLAGADVPRAIVAWLRGAEPDPSWFRPKVGVLGIKDLAVTVVSAR